MILKRYKKLLTLAFVYCITLFSCVSAVNAAEIGPSNVYRWFDVRQINGKNCAYVKINGYCLNEVYDVLYSPALSEWNNNSDGKAFFADTPLSSSNCDLVLPEETYWLAGNGTAGVTYLKNSSGQWNHGASVNPLTTVVSPGFLQGTITYAAIYFNPDPPWVYQEYQYHYLVRHEMGHVLGLGHPSDSTPSIMHDNILSTSWHTLQSYDRTELNRFYP